MLSRAQRLAPDLTAVVLHSTHAFAERALDVYGDSLVLFSPPAQWKHGATQRAAGVNCATARYGATSTAARVGGAACDAEREAGVLRELRAAAAARLAPRWIAREV